MSIAIAAVGIVGTIALVGAVQDVVYFLKGHESLVGDFVRARRRQRLRQIRGLRVIIREGANKP